MSKKDFTGGLDSLIEGYQKSKKVGRPRTNFKEVTKTSQEGTKEKETRATFILNEELLEKVKAIAYWDRLLIKEVIDTALRDAVAEYEKENGEIKPIPKR